MRSLSRSLSAFVSSWMVCGSVTLGGCSDGEGAAAPRSSTSSTTPTFHKDVEPILQRSCMTCHSEGNIAPFALTSYAAAKPYASLIAQQTRQGTMPPFAVRSTDECTTRLGWKDDTTLSAAQLDTLEAWANAGAPEGDPDDAPAPFVPEGRDLPGMTHEVSLPAPYVVSGSGDEFRCVVVDLGLTEDMYLTASQVVPGNSKIVHHAIIGLDPKRSLADKVGTNNPCNNLGVGMTGVEGMTLDMLGSWAPGADPMVLPDGVGRLVPKGSLVQMNLHYHPHGTPDDAVPDLTRIQFRFTKQKPKYGASYLMVGNFSTPVNALGAGLLPGPDDASGVEFRIPANAKAHTETQQLIVPDDASLLSAILRFPPGSRLYGNWMHMHYLGVDQKITVSRAHPSAEAPAEECLAQAPSWDFSWQRTYAYDAPIESLPPLDPGDTLKIRCTYDNTMDNRYVVQALSDLKATEPVDVGYGEGSTLDEMCLAGLSIVYPLE